MYTQTVSESTAPIIYRASSEGCSSDSEPEFDDEGADEFDAWLGRAGVSGVLGPTRLQRKNEKRTAQVQHVWVEGMLHVWVEGMLHVRSPST